MTLRIKKFWKWNEELNKSKFKLGADIKELLQQGFIAEATEPNTYKVVKGDAEEITIIEDEIRSIYFKGNFPFLEKEDWNLELHILEKKIDQLLEPTDDEKIGDKLFLFSRGGFVSFICLYRYSNSEYTL